MISFIVMILGIFDLFVSGKAESGMMGDVFETESERGGAIWVSSEEERRRH